VTCGDVRPIITGMSAPFLCPHGHGLGPGRTLVGWAPCQCPPALKGNMRGHRTYQCLACLDEHVDTVMYEPEHVGGGHPAR